MVELISVVLANSATIVVKFISIFVKVTLALEPGKIIGAGINEIWFKPFGMITFGI